MQWIKPLILVCALTLGFSAVAEEPSSTINLNTATAQELSTLKGIGKAKAEAIIQYRETMGKFQTIDDLTHIKGIGANILEQNRAILALE